jgi:hypothetical protein
MVADLDTVALAEDTELDLAASVVDMEEDMAALAEDTAASEEDTAASEEDTEEDTPPDLYLLSLSVEVTVLDTAREAVSEEEDTVVALVEATDTDAHTVEY